MRLATSICDQYMCEVLIHLKQNYRGSSQHKITSILLADVHTDRHMDTHADSTIPPTPNIRFAGVMISRRDAEQHKSKRSTELRS